MGHHSSIRISLGAVAVLCTIATGHAQETTPSLAQTTPAHATDRATILMRREAKAKIAERERVFDRIKQVLSRVPAPVAAPNAVQGIGLVQFDPLAGRVDVLRVNQGINRFIMIQRLPTLEVADDDDADPNLGALPKFVVAEQTFEHCVFGSLGGRDSARKLLEAFQTRRIESIVQQQHLSPDKEKKLVLAARGDLKRLFDRVEESRKQFDLVRTDINRCRLFLQELQPIDRAMRQNLLDDESIFAKTLRRMIKDDDGRRAN